MIKKNKCCPPQLISTIVIPDGSREDETHPIFIYKQKVAGSHLKFQTKKRNTIHLHTHEHRTYEHIVYCRPAKVHHF